MLCSDPSQYSHAQKGDIYMLSLSWEKPFDQFHSNGTPSLLTSKVGFDFESWGCPGSICTLSWKASIKLLGMHPTFCLGMYCYVELNLLICTPHLESSSPCTRRQCTIYLFQYLLTASCFDCYVVLQGANYE